MLNPAELSTAAKTAVAGHLQHEGWTVTDLNPGCDGPADISASKDGVTILVRIKAALLPQLPDALTQREVQRILSTAAPIQASPYEARVQLDPPNAPSIRYVRVRERE